LGAKIVQRGNFTALDLKYFVLKNNLDRIYVSQAYIFDRIYRIYRINRMERGMNPVHPIHPVNPV